MLQSWKGDLLHKPGGARGTEVTMWPSEFEKSEWTIGAASSGAVTFQSWESDYLNDGDCVQTGAASEWTVSVVGPAENEVALQSWKGDYLHKPDGGGVTTSPSLDDFHNYWTVIRVG